MIQVPVNLYHAGTMIIEPLAGMILLACIHAIWQHDVAIDSQLRSTVTVR